jgi:RNA-directed DNA polymerase
MYVLEGSDCAILPMKLPNKGANASAEAAEGRAQTKGNDAQLHTDPTQSGPPVSQGLGGVRRTAQGRKQERFTALLHHLTIDLLRASYSALKRKAAPGVDGVSWQQYEQGVEERLVDLHGRVHRGAYRAHPSRRVYIPKADGRQRPFASVRSGWPIQASLGLSGLGGFGFNSHYPPYAARVMTETAPFPVFRSFT